MVAVDREYSIYFGSCVEGEALTSARFQVYTASYTVRSYFNIIILLSPYFINSHTKIV